MFRNRRVKKMPCRCFFDYGKPEERLGKYNIPPCYRSAPLFQKRKTKYESPLYKEGGAALAP